MTGMPFKIFFLTFLLNYVYCLEVAPDSGCSDLCVDIIGPATNISSPFASGTFPTDLVCEDSQINGTDVAAVGRKWQQCVSCEASSDTSSSGINNDNETDVFWFIFNVRYNFDWCVFGYPSNNETTTAAKACGQICDAILDPMTNKLFTESQSNRYEYCTRNDGAFTDHATSCQQCLEKVEGASILANYIKALQIVCEQRPAMGKPLELGFNIFATSSSTSVTTSATISTASAAKTDSNQYESNSRVKIGVGVGVGVGGAILLTAVGLFLWRRRKVTSNINSGQRIKSYIIPEQRQCEELEVPERKGFVVELGPGGKHHDSHELEAR
ncbi:hypothetical protein N7519_001291 [Penicillium mononematosum]|uniref:uncharacterized protein n=1 Tax=Penicillium mononematosum TaxID=268346 RepID=UPI002546B6EF|nr:uncharacterized protein N7519_001291 [Penicillium mononematosum]KAJ6191270.1 hypothetical protein N7519_001291 [Penicillium mononematosum]